MRPESATPDLHTRLAGSYALDFADDFDDPALDTTRWLPHYLPQWSSREASAARFELSGGCLHLLIEADQQPWCPELDGPTRVSSLQTGLFAGPPGTTIGQHRFHPEAVVREDQPNTRLYTPHYGVVALRARFPADPHGMAALWMIGYEDEPHRSGEICVCEIFGNNITPASARIGMGVHPFADPSLTDDFAEVELPIDVTTFHDYAVEWTPHQVGFFVDGALVRTVDQSPNYPMQLMLGLYDFSAPNPARTAPQRFTVDWVRGYRRADT